MFLLAAATKDANKSVHNKLVTLKKNYEFQFVFKTGKRLFSPSFSLIVAPCKKKYPKFGFVISKKIGKAVVRNKRRRQFKEIARKHLLNAAPFQYVFVIKPEIETKSFFDIETEVLKLFEKHNYLEAKE